MTDRAEKLKQLQEKKGSNMVIMTNGAEFLEAFQNKIAELREVFGTELDVPLDGLLDQLETIKTIAPAVAELKEAIAGIEMPEVPDKIELVGLDPVVAMVAEHIKHLNAVKSFKIPDAKVKVEIVDNQKIEEVTKRLDDVIKAVQDNSPSQKPEDFLPVRRVRLIANKLVFDDMQWGGGGGGGGVPLHNAWDKKAYTSLKATPAKVKDANGAFGGYMVTNNNDYVVYLRIFDTNSSPNPATDGGYPFGIPAQAAANVEFTNGIKMGDGIYIAATKEATGNNAPTNGLDLTVLYE